MRRRRMFPAFMGLIAAAAVLLPAAAGAVDSPQIQVQARSAVVGGAFLSNTDITIAIDRADGGLEDPITHTTDENGNFVFRLEDAGSELFAIGDRVTVRQGAVAKDLTVGAIEVFGSDITADTVWGIAEPGSAVIVSVELEGSQGFRRTVAAISGEWSVDFSVPGSDPEEPVVDLDYDMSGQAFGPPDADGDVTGWWWWTGAPGLWVSVHNLGGWAWAQPGPVVISVDDPTLAGIELTTTMPLDQNGGFNLVLAEGSIRPGHVVTATDSHHTISFRTPSLTITGVDIAANVIQGAGDPGAAITVWASADDESSQGNVIAVVAGDGTWVADFTGIVDVSYGWNGTAEQELVPNGRFADNWQVPAPVIFVNQVNDDISGDGWPLGHEVTVTVDDPEVEGEIADFAFTVTPFAVGSKYPAGGFHQFTGDEFPIESGHIVTASNVSTGGDVIKVLVIEPVEIVAVQTSFETAVGRAPANTAVTVYIVNQQGGNRTAVADAEGWWQVNFSVGGGSEDPEENKIVDLQLGTHLEVQLDSDEDGDYVRHTRAIEPHPGGGLPAVEHTVGLVNPNSGQWRLRDEAGTEHSFWFGTPGDIPMMGDWDCDGDETPGLYRQSDGYVYLRNSNDTGPGEIRFTIGIEGDIPLAGDFNGDGCDTVAVYRPNQGHVFMTNVLGEDEGFFVAEYDYYFGFSGDKPFVGDFDGDGVETVGLHRESTGFVYFRQTHTTGVADHEFFFGNPDDRILAGDWNLSYQDTVAIFRPGNSTFYFRNSNTLGLADSTMEWGKNSWIPIAGEFGLSI